MPTKRNHALIYRKIPPFLRELRRKAKLTQRQLARRIGQDQWWVTRCESGSRRVDVAEFVEFCIGCGADPAEALTELARRRRSASSA
jgi:transcriptional regulator with XRE-family HTH domain